MENNKAHIAWLEKEIRDRTFEIQINTNKVEKAIIEKERLENELGRINNPGYHTEKCTS